MKKAILLAVAVAGVFTLTASAQTVQPLLSPRAQEQANSLRKVPAVAGEPDLNMNRMDMIGSPRAYALAQSLRKVPHTGVDVDLAHAPRPNMSVKNPGYEAAWRSNAFNQQIQVAPLK